MSDRSRPSTTDDVPTRAAMPVRRRLRSPWLVAAMLATPIAAVAAFPGTAAAAAGSTWGYAWANLPTTTDYTPSLAYQRQSNGQHATVHRNGTGDYVVTFPGIASSTSGGIVQVTAYYTNGECQSDGWFNSGVNVVASVICFAPGAVPADLYFNVMFTAGAGTPALAYAWDNLPTASGYVSSNWSFDGKRGSIYSQHTGTGNYTLTVPNLAGSNGTVKVTPYGPTDSQCFVISWGGNTVRIFCSDAFYHPKDTAFNLSFTNRLPLIGVGGHKNGYLLNYNINGSYTAGGFETFDSTGGSVTVGYLGSGQYVVHFAGISQSRGDVQVSAYGNGNALCNSSGWYANAGTEDVYVTCTVSNGTADLDSLFTVQFFV
jgi:hypothetical protein